MKYIIYNRIYSKGANETTSTVYYSVDQYKYFINSILYANNFRESSMYINFDTINRDLCNLARNDIKRIKERGDY